MARVETQHTGHLLKTPGRKLAERRRKGKHYFSLLADATLPIESLSGGPLDKTQLFKFLTLNRLGVLSTLGPKGEPQSALVGFAVTPEFEIIFDTVSNSRKFRNLARDPRAAFVIGWEGEKTA